jgi:sterol desaturase/sphingolipid hydroxylase (fatty acid hydroxylase superfamily)
MADLAFPTSLTPVPGAVLGRGHALFSDVGLVPAPGHPQSDLRNIRPNTGTVSDRVVLKINSTTEVPFVLARVWLLRAADGYKAWEGWSDAGGYYTATGLELGVDYVVMAQDPARVHKTTAAGPVTAV